MSEKKQGGGWMQDVERLLVGNAEVIERNIQTLDLVAAGMERLIDRVKRHDAWESILYLFFARYYLGRDDPAGAATHDRDFLAGCHRKHGQDEEGAREVEAIYKTIFVLIETAQRHQSTLESEGDGESVM
jgi:hypothetical protein